MVFVNNSFLLWFGKMHDLEYVTKYSHFKTSCAVSDFKLTAAVQ